MSDVDIRVVILANVKFGSAGNDAGYELQDLAEGYLGCLSKTGQLCGEPLVSWTKGTLNAYVLLADRRASAVRHHSEYGKRELRKVIKAFGKRPTWKILDDDARLPLSSWKRAPFLYLFTHAFDDAPPVCRGDGKPAVPTFLLPITFEQSEQLFFWQGRYREIDRLWFDSGALEVVAYQQLADPNSELSEDGRELCREIENVTRIPTFYYLMRHWKRAKGEDERLCPECGASWRTARAQDKSVDFWRFDFKCDPCRLVSHLGVSSGGGRQVRVGEFRRQRQATV